MLGLVDPSSIFREYSACIGGGDWEARFVASPVITGMTYLWSINGGSFNSGDALYMLNQWSDPSVNLDIKYQNACGTTAPLSSQFGGNPVTYYSPCSGFRAVISPNPAKDYFDVSIEDYNTGKKPAGNKVLEVSIYDFGYSTLFKKVKGRIGLKTQRISIRNLKPGKYIAVIQYGEQRIGKQFVID